MLTAEIIQKAIEAQVRLHELGGNSTIINPKAEAEIIGLKKFLSEIYMEHGAELVGSWVIIHQEYQPLVTTLERIFNRVRNINAQRQANESK
jgi:hypothetical protein